LSHCSNSDYFNDVLTNFLGWQWPVSITIEAYGGVRQPLDFIKNILICVPKMNESLTWFEQLITDRVFIFG